MMTILPVSVAESPNTYWHLHWRITDSKENALQMVALIRNHHAIATDNIIDDPFLHQTLN